jgi:hypothetical protein
MTSDLNDPTTFVNKKTNFEESYEIGSEIGK